MASLPVPSIDATPQENFGDFFIWKSLTFYQKTPHTSLTFPTTLLAPDNITVVAEDILGWVHFLRLDDMDGDKINNFI